jgi:hypothetical protein
MTRLPAKVLIVDRLVDQYLITVKVCENQRCKFDKLNFGEKKPDLASYRNGWLDLAYHENPNLKAGQSFPLRTVE